MRFEGLQKVALALSQERSLEVLFKRIADELGHHPDVALARLWMNGPAEQCEVCRCRPDAARERGPLHVRASAGGPIDGYGDWSRLDDDFHSGGVNVRYINETCTPLLIKEVGETAQRPKWVRRQQIRSFAGHPLVFGGERLGVIAVFTRITMNESDFEWLRVFAVAMAAAIANARAFEEIERLRRRLESDHRRMPAARAPVSDAPILGSSAGIRQVLEQIEMVAPTDAAVFILGETGVGKELVARAIHRCSPRRAQPLVSVNCTAIPHELFESIFFGHMKGAYSGAISDRMGRFQLADRGSLFLDEVGDLPADVQPKLLRVLQDGEFEPVGSEKPLHADVRIIAASNHDMRKSVAREQFREDLYYRLSVFPIEVPPLRERKEDIPVLSSHFVAAACRRFEREPLQLSESHLHQLQDYDWPGNVRELQNVIERAVITSRMGSLRLDIAQPIRNGTVPADVEEIAASSQTQAILTDEEMKRRERDNVAAALKLSGGRIYGAGGAAERLGMKPTTLNARIKKWGIGKSLDGSR